MATQPGSDKTEKNRLIGFSRILARQLIKDLSIQYDEKAENKVESSAAGVACAKRQISTQIFSDVVAGVLEIIKTNPSIYQRKLKEMKLKILHLQQLISVTR